MSATPARRPTDRTVRCPSCGLTLAAHFVVLVPQYCPRCLARRRIAIAIAIELEAAEPSTFTPNQITAPHPEASLSGRSSADCEDAGLGQ
jgi:phage FluMu protein Com